MESLDAWTQGQYAQAARKMLWSVSPTGVIKTRPGAGQRIVPCRGSIVASPVPGAYDPDPDYFFHWYRDAAVVLDAVRILFEDGSLGAQAPGILGDFVRFSLSLRDLDGRRLVAGPQWRAQVEPDFQQFLRTDEDLAGVHGDAVAADTRVNPDGTVDILNWARPQNDGPPAQALALMRWSRTLSRAGLPDDPLHAGLSELITAGLEFTCRHWNEPCFDIWEEEKGFHYYTLSVSAAALQEGAEWLEAHDEVSRAGSKARADLYREHAQSARQRLDTYWTAEEGYYRSRVLETGVRSAKELDVSVILAALQAPPGLRTHSAQDPRIQATLGRLEALFDSEYPINRSRARTRAPALGRYGGDVYYAGNPWYISTLAAAELCYRAALQPNGTDHLVDRGDEFLETVRVFTPPTGDMSEQFDRVTGEQKSAKHLAWSYAAFISCIAARRRVTSTAATR